MAEGGIQIRVESQGIDELKEIFDKLPAKVAKRPLQSTLRRAAKPLEQEVKNTLPVRLKDMGQAVTTKNMRSFAGVKTGVYTKRVAVMIGSEGKEKQWDAYYLLYWHNYGTLSRRDPSHKFQKKVNIRKSHLSPGIHPRRFIQKAYESKAGEVVKYAEEHLLSDAEKFLDRNANRFLKKQVV